MEKLRCKRCGRDLEETKNGFYCKSCYAKYAVINGELQLLECKSCGGELSDHGDHYACNLCGKRYEKAVPKPAPKAEKPVPKPEPVVSEPAQKEEKHVPKPEPDSQNPQEEEKISWEECLAEGCNALYNINFPNMIVSLEYAKLCYLNVILLIAKEESIKDVNYVINKFITCFLAAFYHAYLYFNFHFRDYPTSKKDMNETLDKYIAQFLEQIYACTRDVLYTKMVTEKALALFAEFGEDSNIFKFFKVLEGAVGEDQKEISAMYWEKHPEKLKKLMEERNSLCEIVAGHNELEDIAETAKKETEKIRSEISEVRDCYHKVWSRSIRLNFFQKKEKKKLEEEMLSLVVSERNLKEKLKLREKEEEKISKKVKKKQEKALVRINEIDSEIDSAHYPFEDDFIEMFERKIRKVEDNFEKK